MFTDNNPLLMYSPQQNWILLAIAGWRPLLILISRCTTSLEHATETLMHCLGGHYRNQDVADQREKIHILEGRLQGEKREAESKCDDEVIHAISAGLMARPVGSEFVETTPYPLVYFLAMSTEAIPTLYFTPGGDVSSGPVDWKKEQSKDQTIKKILPAVRVKRKPKVVADMTSQEKIMLAHSSIS